MSKKRILWVSLYAPYDKVGHAGGKIENYYLKKLHRTNKYDIFLISFYEKREKEYLDTDKYGIKSQLFDKDVWYRKILNLESTLNPFNRNACSLQNYYEIKIKKALKEYKEKEGKPDLIILQWTQTILLSTFVKKMFMDVPIFGIEEDVQFLSYDRKRKNCKNIVKKTFYNITYKRLKSIEIKSLKKNDLVCVNNIKDYDLLIENEIEKDKIIRWCPWFDNYSYLNNKCSGKNIVFYGAMARSENYLSAEWFINNCMPELDDSFRLLIIGSNPPERLKKYQNSRIIITGFVEKVDSYFEDCFALVAPLVLGAGVKIKVIEAMSAGIPVLTNDIGIEGIPAKDKIHYLHCKDAKDYIINLNELENNPNKRNEYCINSKRFVEDNFDLNQSFVLFESNVDNLLQKKK